MAVGRYFNIQWRQPQSMMVPRPFQELAAVGDATQHRYQKGLDDLADAANMIHINADPKHEQHRDQLLNKYNSQIADLSDAFIKQGATPENQMKLNSLKKNFANDPNRLQLESNYKNYLEYKKDAQKLFIEGKYDPINSEYDPYHHLQTSENNVTPFRYTGMKPVTDFYKPAHEMMAGVKGSGYSSEAFNFDQDGNIISVKSGKEQIARNDINRVALAKVPLFLSHADSRYFKDKFFANNSNGTVEDLQKAAYDYLRREGENQIHSKTSYGQDFNYAPEHVAKKKLEESSVPVYTTPGQQVSGIDRGDIFDLQTKGQRIPYSDKEIDAIYNKYKSVKDGDEVATHIINQGKTRQDHGFSNIQEMKKEDRNFVLSYLKSYDSDMYNKVSKGQDLSESEKAKIFPKLKQIVQIASQDLKQSSTSIGLTPNEAKTTNLDLFGNVAEGSNTVDKLGTGQAGNLKFFDKSSGKVIDLNELKDMFDGNETVSVRGKLTADHPYTFVTNDDQFAAPKQLFIGGKEFIVSGPKQYVDPTTGSNDTREQHKLERTKVANEIYNTKFSLSPELKSFYNVPATVGFVPYDNNDRSKGDFIVKLASDNKTRHFNTAQEAEDFILSQAK